MFNKAVFPGKYIQGAGVLKEIASLAQPIGNRGLILASPTSVDRIIPEARVDLSDMRIVRFQGECCESEVQRVSAIIKEMSANVVVGMGGGKAIDTAKIAADRAGIPVIVVPTIASTDAPCSGCAVLYSENGVFQSVYYQKSNPAAVIVDEEVIARAPVRFLVAGMGDALATWFEAESCRRTRSRNECGGLSTLAALNIARLCYDTLLEHGVKATLACKDHIVTAALSHVIEANTLLSGIGFESSGLACAHSVHNGLTALKETHSFYHGEKVAFGVLVGLHLNDAPGDEMNTVYSFCESVGLPTTLADLAIANAGRDALLEAAEKACAPSEGIHHEAGSISPERVLSAMMAADAMGRERKA